jgi:hypothetical protein
MKLADTVTVLAVGAIKLAREITPVSAKSLATSPMRRMFSSRSAAEKPRFLLKPWRTLSPSST